MFGRKGKKPRSDVMGDLSGELDRARARRDALAGDVTSLSTQIAELEARLSAEKERRERERVTRQIADIRKQLEESAATFASVVARLCDATAAAAAEIIPEARELNGLLAMVATEVNTEIDSLLCALRQRAETVRTGEPEEFPSPPASQKPTRVNERLPLLLPAFLPRNRETPQVEAAEERASTAA
jgi:ABC-type transporter Mla subunit MlaD